jgi:DUF1365 family protein
MWKPRRRVLAVNRRGAISFHDVDHGDGRSAAQGGALAWLDELLRTEGITDATGEVWLHCYPRVLGYTFKPVSFWYCHRKRWQPARHRGGGQQHLWRAPLLPARCSPAIRRGAAGATRCSMCRRFARWSGGYRFRFMRTPASAADAGRTVVRIDHDDDDRPLLIQTSVSGTLQPATHRPDPAPCAVGLPRHDAGHRGPHPLACAASLWTQARAVPSHNPRHPPPP